MRSELALLAHAEVPEAVFGDRLSAREAAALAALANPDVRRRRLAGRLAAKSLLLRHREGSAAAAGGLVVLDAERLRALPADRYREVELLAAGDDGPPRASVQGRPLASRLSISHRGGLSCAALSAADAAVGVDLETVVPRAGAFYRGNFTPRERRWVAAGAAAGGLSAAWLYTFLWTVKEAALKSGATAVRSVWDFPAMEVELPAELAERLAASRGGELGERFAAFDGAVSAAGRRTRGRVETTSTREAILSLFTATP